MSTHLSIEINDNNQKEEIVDTLKNLNRLDSVIVNECGKRCFANFKSEKLNSTENACITACFQKFYDTIDIGDKLFELFSNKHISTTALKKGKYDEVMNNLKPNFDI
jgi:hypothetical protein